MTIADTIRSRRSIRSFNAQPVSTDLIVELINDAVWAPNHGMREPWRFILAERAEAKEHVASLMLESVQNMKLMKLMPGKLQQALKNKISRMPAHLIVVMKNEKDPHKQEEDYAAVSCVIQNFQLLAWEQGLGMIWSTMEYIHSPIFCEGLSVKSDERIVGVLHMGYFDKTPKPKPRTSAEQKLTLL